MTVSKCDNNEPCDACGINPWRVIVEGWHVCFLCVSEFAKETDEAFDWWIEIKSEVTQNEPCGRTSRMHSW